MNGKLARVEEQDMKVLVDGDYLHSNRYRLYHCIGNRCINCLMICYIQYTVFYTYICAHRISVSANGRRNTRTREKVVQKLKKMLTIWLVLLFTWNNNNCLLALLAILVLADVGAGNGLC